MLGLRAGTGASGIEQALTGLRVEGASGILNECSSRSLDTLGASGRGETGSDYPMPYRVN